MRVVLKLRAHGAVLSEYTVCDKTVISTRNYEQKRKYSRLLIEMASLDNSGFMVLFSNEKNELKERITYIMKEKKTTRRAKFLTTILTVSMILSSSITVLAYQSPRKFELTETNDLPIHLLSDEILEFKPSANKPMPGNDRLVYEMQFTDQNGVIYNIVESNVEYKTCDHTYIDGETSIHSKKTNGSCVTKYYDSKRCTKCGKLVKGELTETRTFQKCPH